MSRIGNTPIHIPENVNIEIINNIVKITGPKGNLEQYINPVILLKQENKKIYLINNKIKKKVNLYMDYIDH